MQCMRCGRDVETGEVFCTDCLKVMEQYPVKPGTVVQLPHRTETVTQKKQSSRRKAVLPAEEQLKLLKRMTRGLAIALAVTILAIIGLAYTTVSLYIENNTKRLPGQNYSAISTTVPTTEATEVATETADGVVAG